VNPALVLPDKEGKPYSVRYEAVNAMLLNRFLKEHRKVEQLKKDLEYKLAEQRDEINALKGRIERAGIVNSKVSAQLQLSKSEPQT
jgi:hypothetical protein